MNNNKKTNEQADVRKQNIAGYGAVKFAPGGGFIVGLDYINWKTVYVDKPSGYANRLNLYLIYQF